MIELDAEERRVLLRLARASLDETVRGVTAVAPLVEQVSLTRRMQEPRGAFVTLKLPPLSAGGARTLRGCIGVIASERPLFRNVVEVAAKSARDDPRFSPVTPEELDRIYVEVSALTELAPVAGPEAVQPGVHGVQLQKGSAGAVFLPQVASERGWGVEELLGHLAVKAGLPKDGWVGARLSVFQAQVFGDP